MLADFGHIHQKWRAIMSQSGPGKWLNAAKLLRPLVAQAHDILREHFEAGSSVEDYLRARAKLADSAVVGLLRIASISNGIRNRSMVAPLAAIAVGGYGRKELAPGSDLDLLFLLPESSRAAAGGVAPATKACISAVVASLWDLGFVLDHARGQRVNPSSLQGPTLPFLPAWSTGGFYGAVSASSLLSTPI